MFKPDSRFGRDPEAGSRPVSVRDFPNSKTMPHLGQYHSGRRSVHTEQAIRYKEGHILIGRMGGSR